MGSNPAEAIESFMSRQYVGLDMATTPTSKVSPNKAVSSPLVEVNGHSLSIGEIDVACAEDGCDVSFEIPEIIRGDGTRVVIYKLHLIAKAKHVPCTSSYEKDDVATTASDMTVTTKNAGQHDVFGNGMNRVDSTTKSGGGYRTVNGPSEIEHVAPEGDKRWSVMFDDGTVLSMPESEVMKLLVKQGDNDLIRRVDERRKNRINSRRKNHTIGHYSADKTIGGIDLSTDDTDVKIEGKDDTDKNDFKRRLAEKLQERNPVIR